ncbi:MAG TPA: hypothetical protein VJO33_11605, partial [Gemmatimonadaceae bacterium]|nr:hypothetical protein [Gemmatimonadaceae bacterium]
MILLDPPDLALPSPQMNVSWFAKAIAERGWVVTPPIIDNTTVLALRDVTASLAREGRAGVRNILADERIRALAASSTLRHFACAVLGADCFGVRAILFDKTPDANWKVVWH